MNNPLHTLAQRLFLSALVVSSGVHAEEILLDRVAVIVNNDVIMESELDRRSAVIKQQLSERNTQLPAPAEFRQQVLDKLITDQLQMQQAEQYGYKITDDDLNRTLQRIADSNQLSLEQFKQQLEAEGQNYREVREQIRAEMLVTQIRERLVNKRIQVSDQEVENYLASEQGRKKAEPEIQLAHLMIPIAEPGSASDLKFAAELVQRLYAELISGANFAQIAVAHSKGQTALKGGDLGWRNRGDMPEKIAEEVANLQPGELTKPFRLGAGFHVLKLIDIRGGNVQLIDQTRARHILVKTSEIRDQSQALALIQELYQRIRAGEPFADLARRYSDDPGSGSEGGDLGWSNPGQMVPAFETAMAGTATGDLSEPFQSRFGWHILEVLERRSQDFGERILSNQARENIRKRKFAEEASNWIRELRAQAYIEKKY